MRPRAGLAAAAVVLCVLSACAAATPPAGTDTSAERGSVPCHGPYVADVDTSAAGEPTPGAAAVAWSKSVLAPAGAPTDGWTPIDVETLRSGDWTVGVTSTVSGGWLVSGLGCGSPGS